MWYGFRYENEVRAEREKNEREALFRLITEKLGKKDEYRVKAFLFLSEEERVKKINYEIERRRSRSWQYIDAAFEMADLANILPEPYRTEELEKFLREMRCNTGRFSFYRKICELLNQKVSSEVILKMILTFVENPNQCMDDNIAEMIDLVSKEEKERWVEENYSKLEKKLEEQVHMNWDLHLAMGTLHLFTESKRTKMLEKILQMAIVDGRVTPAFQIAELLKYTLTPKEIEKMFRVCMISGYLGYAQKLRKLLNRDLTPEEDFKIALLEHPNDWRLVKRLSEPERTERLRKILSLCLQWDRLEDAEAIMDLLVQKD